MNPLHPRHLTPAERRAELCRILALGLVRLHTRKTLQHPAAHGDFSLHNPPDQSGSADARHRRET